MSIPIVQKTLTWGDREPARSAVEGDLFWPLTIPGDYVMSGKM